MIIRTLAAAACLVFLALGAYEQNVSLLYISGACLALLLLLQIVHGLESGNIVCPNCRSQIMIVRGCAKHRQARKLFGSYTLRLALDVVFTNTFRCHFCNQHYQWRGKRREKNH